MVRSRGCDSEERSKLWPIHDGQVFFKGEAYAGDEIYLESIERPGLKHDIEQAHVLFYCAAVQSDFDYIFKLHPVLSILKIVFQHF